jgi:hypothetical protein
MIMDKILFLLATAFVGLSAIYGSYLFQLKSSIERLLVIFTLGISQVCAVLLLMGMGFKMLEPVPIILCNIFYLLLIITFFYFKKRSIMIRLSLKGLFDSLKTSSWTTILIFLVCGEVIWLTTVAYLFPPFEYDTMTYHLVAVAAWIQSGEINITPYSIWTNVYPKNTELIYTWLALFLQSDRITDLGQLLFALGGSFAVSGIAREFKVSKSLSVAAGCLFFLTPLVLVQAKTAYTDLSFAAMFLVFFYFVLRYVTTEKSSYILFAGLAGGVTLGIKSSAFAYVGIGIMVVLTAFIIQMIKRRISLKQFILNIMILSLPMFFLGLIWYIRTWLVYGNPLYPFTLSFMGTEIFSGKGTVNDLIMVSNTPQEYAGLSWWKQVWLSWISDTTLQSFWFDQRFGGYGLQWLYIMFPAAIAFSIYSFVYYKKAFICFVLPFVLIFIIQPSNWWTRYTLFFVALGAISLVFLLEHIKKRWLIMGIKGFTLLFVIISVFFSMNHRFPFTAEKVTKALELEPKDRTIGQLRDPDFLWVDKINSGSKIGTNDHYIYPFFRMDFKNEVQVYHQKDKKTFISAIIKGKPDYFVTQKDEKYAKWADQEPSMFIKEYVTRKSFVYKIIN